MGKSTSAFSVLPWSGYRGLSQFFIKPNLKLFVTQADKQAWKDIHEIRIKHSPTAYIQTVRFLSFTIVNKGTAPAEKCKVQLVPVQPFSWRNILRSLFAELEPPRPLTLAWNTELPDKEFDGFWDVSSIFRREATIEPRIGVDQIIVAYLWQPLTKTVKKTTAYFSTMSLKPIPFRNMDVRILVVGSNCNTWGRFNIYINSWDDFKISKVTKLTLIKRAMKSIYRFFWQYK